MQKSRLRDNQSALAGEGQLESAARRHSAWSRTTGGFIATMVGVTLAVLFLFPFAWSAFSSFGYAPAGQATTIPTSFSLSNYSRLAAFGTGLPTYLWNTIQIAVLTVLFTLLVAVPAGYAFARFNFPAKPLIFFGILSVMMVPHSSLLVPLYSILAKLGGTNSIIVLALMYATFQLPFAVYMMRNSFESIPPEMDESALVDGCGPVRALVRVVLPIAVPGAVTVGLFAFLMAWNEFLSPLVFLTDDRKFTLPVALQSISVGQLGSVDYGALQAGITVSALPCIILFLALQRYYVSGLISGALKG